MLLEEISNHFLFLFCSRITHMALSLNPVFNSVFFLGLRSEDQACGSEMDWDSGLTGSQCWSCDQDSG